MAFAFLFFSFPPKLDVFPLVFPRNSFFAFSSTGPCLLEAVRSLGATLLVLAAPKIQNFSRAFFFSLPPFEGGVFDRSLINLAPPLRFPYCSYLTPLPPPERRGPFNPVLSLFLVKPGTSSFFCGLALDPPFLRPFFLSHAPVFLIFPRGEPGLSLPSFPALARFCFCVRSPVTEFHSPAFCPEFLRVLFPMVQNCPLPFFFFTGATDIRPAVPRWVPSLGGLSFPLSFLSQGGKVVFYWGDAPATI